MASVRYLTLVWPGLPWLWLRGSLAGLVLAVAFAVTLDVALITTFIWPDLVELSFILAVWTAAAIVWLVSTVSAVAAFHHRWLDPFPRRSIRSLFAPGRPTWPETGSRPRLASGNC